LKGLLVDYSIKHHFSCFPSFIKLNKPEKPISTFWSLFPCTSYDGGAMPILDYQSIMLPLLKLLGDRKEHHLREVVDTLADQFRLSEEERREPLPSGTKPVFENRVGWAVTYLRKAALLESTRRGHFQITDRGMAVIRESPAAINVKFLDRFPEFQEFRAIRKKKPQSGSIQEGEEERTPEESLESAYQNLRNNLAGEILQQIKSSPPQLFERVVPDLLVKMGYGGSRRDAAEAIGRVGDEGIDGIIKEDRLGLDTIYIQAKRWDNTVGRPEIQKFAGALAGQRARKDIFITASNFSKEAQDYISRIDTKIILIDGETLAQYMIDYNVGVTTVSNYEVKKLDLDYFTEG
jgi:restriction system protein